jgi:hypothetical protein
LYLPDFCLAMKAGTTGAPERMAITANPTPVQAGRPK